jgi:hypothetical protein
VITNGIVAATTSVLSTSQFRSPPGPATLLLANAGTAPTLYVGTGTNVSVGEGFPVPNGLVPPVAVPVYAGCGAQTWSVVTSSGAGTLSWIFSTPTGGTGP